MELDKVKLVVQWLIGVLTPILVRYGMTNVDIDLWKALAMEVVPPVAMFGWALYEKRHKTTLANAGAILAKPGTDGRPSGTIVVSPNASNGAAAAASDPKVPNVNYVEKQHEEIVLNLWRRHGLGRVRR